MKNIIKMGVMAAVCIGALSMSMSAEARQPVGGSGGFSKPTTGGGSGGGLPTDEENQVKKKCTLICKAAPQDKEGVLIVCTEKFGVEVCTSVDVTVPGTCKDLEKACIAAAAVKHPDCDVIIAVPTGPKQKPKALGACNKKAVDDNKF